MVCRPHNPSAVQDPLLPRLPGRLARDAPEVFKQLGTHPTTPPSGGARHAVVGRAQTRQGAIVTDALAGVCDN